MKLILSSVIALGLAVDSVVSVYLRNTQTSADLATNTLGGEDGEVMIEIDNTNADLTPLCRLILMDAFNDSYDQVYGIDTMTVILESEQVIPGDITTLSTAAGFRFKTYWVSNNRR